MLPEYGSIFFICPVPEVQRSAMLTGTKKAGTELILQATVLNYAAAGTPTDGSVATRAITKILTSCMKPLLKFLFACKNTFNTKK